MPSVRGMNVLPSQIETEWLQVEAVQPHYATMRGERGAIDDLEVSVQVSGERSLDDISRLR